MATILLCDGCDAELKLGDRVEVKVSSTDHFFNPREFDLCKACAQLAYDNWNAKNWPRQLGTTRRVGFWRR